MPLALILVLMVGATLSYLVAPHLEANDSIKMIPLTEAEYDCTKPTKHIDIQVFCLKKNFTFNGHPVHPKIMEEFNTPLSDTGEQVVAINMSDSQNSNRYCCWSDVQNRGPFIKLDYGKDGWFEYIYRGATTDGILVVEISYSGGGSGVFGELQFYILRQVKELLDERVRYLEDNWFLPLKSNSKRLHLEKLSTILLGDRVAHDIMVEGNYLVLDGKRILLPPESKF